MEMDEVVEGRSFCDGLVEGVWDGVMGVRIGGVWVGWGDGWGIEVDWVWVGFGYEEVVGGNEGMC